MDNGQPVDNRALVATDTGHGRGCPVRKLGRAVAKASR